MLDALYWYASFFLWMFFTGVGIPPVPEEAGILYAAGVYALHPEVKWWFAWPAVALGITAADVLLYGVGRWWGPRLFEYRWVQKVLSAERRKGIEYRFERHGIGILLMARFLPPLRTGVFLIAGATKYSFAKFLLADAIYGVVGVGVFFFAGTWAIGLVDQAKHLLGHWAVWAAAVPVVLYGLYRYFRYLKAREAKGPQPPVSVLQGPEGSVPDGQPATNPAAAPAAEQQAKAVLKD